MAAIDKTYLNKWEDFDKVRNWALNTSFTLKNGEKVNLKDFLYYPNLTKEEWDEWHDEKIKYVEEHYNNPEHTKQCKELYGEDWEFDPENYFDVVLWNTPVYVDIFLIRNCPFEFIQDRLKEQYSGGWSKEAFTNHNDDNTYEQIKNHTSVYDTYQRNGLGKNAKVHFHNYKYGPIPRDKKCRWWIQITNLNEENDFWLYNEYDKMWYSDLEAMPTCSNTAHIKGSLTKKNIVNLIKKWNLPKGFKIDFTCFLTENEYRYSYNFNVTTH